MPFLGDDGKKVGCFLCWYFPLALVIQKIVYSNTPEIETSHRKQSLKCHLSVKDLQFFSDSHFKEWFHKAKPQG